MTALPLLQQREIEAAIIAPIYRAFAKEVGESRARAIVAEVIQNLAREGGCATANQLGGNDLAHLKRVIDRWREGGALELTILRDDAEALEFDVTRCHYAEMYHRLGLADIGPILSCSRDGTMIQGFNPDIAFARTGTLMEGATHCDFRYRRPALESPHCNE